jgi:hypothetical protein
MSSTVAKKSGFGPRKILATLMVLAAGFAMFGMAGFGAAKASAATVRQPASSVEGGVYTPAGTPAASATQVTVGLYGVNAYEIDTASNTFYFKGYMWLRWKGDADPVSTLEFANSVEEWGLMVTNLTEKPMDLPGGVHLQQMRVQGRFFQPFDLSNYPLDKQSLQITVEDTVNDNSAIVYVPDTAQTTYDSHFKVPGWTVDGIDSTVMDHNYVSNLGDTSTKATDFSALTFDIRIHRAQNLFWWKLLLPLVLVLITNWLALLLSPKYVEVRTAMPATALLTTVFLQQSSLDAIPQVSSLVLMDLIYVVAYATVVVTFAQIIWDNHKLKEDDESALKKILRNDRISMVLQALATAAVIAVLVITHS